MANNIGTSVFCFLDSFIVTFIFGPLVVAYWHGTWSLLDLYLFPNDIKVSAWTSLLIGGIVCSTLYILPSFFKKRTSKCNIVLWILCSRCYTYVFGVGSVNYWRGVWYLLNVYTGTGVVSSIVSAAVGMCLMLLLGVSRSLFAPPCVIDYDVGPSFYKCSTRFNIKAGFTQKYFMDVLFTTLLIQGLVPCVWRGFYEFQTNVLYPINHEYSVLASLLIGYAVFLLMLVLQFPVSMISTRLDKRPFAFKLILEDLFTIILTLSGVCIWRGLWESYKLYIWPDDITRSAWFTHALGQFMLMACLVGNSVIPRGCGLDGDLKNGEGVLICNSYYNFYRNYFSVKTYPITDDSKNEEGVLTEIDNLNEPDNEDMNTQENVK